MWILWYSTSDELEVQHQAAIKFFELGNVNKSSRKVGFIMNTLERAEYLEKKFFEIMEGFEPFDEEELDRLLEEATILRRKARESP